MLHNKKTDYLSENASLYIKELFKEKLPAWAVYHNLSHTIDTVNACEEIGNRSGLSKEELNLLNIAAWFHDAGYIYQAEEHEEKSADLASEFLRSKNCEDNKIIKVIECIKATKVAISAKNLPEFVICDADLISLGSADYFKKNELLKLETALREKRKIDDLAWLERSLKFLSSHKYYTDYARENYGPQLTENIKILKRKIIEYR
jgi:predicted metal-dependent HD superfamily phosphohydrolase